jgi:hypothetical protein
MSEHINGIELWSDEYFIESIEKYVKYQISMKFSPENRHPTSQEYDYYFRTWVSKLKCDLTDYDLGNYE